MKPTRATLRAGAVRWLAGVLPMLAGTAILGAAEPPQATGLLTGISFNEYSPLALEREIAARMLTPIATALMERKLAQSAAQLRAQPIDLAAEKFTLYVPHAAPPPQGYALLVFVPPWDEALLPAGWATVLEQFHTIFVSAKDSGNAASVLERRVPLALLAAENLMHRYPVDPRHVYVGGFSGGSRVALRLALDYPDLFQGVLMNAGSDAIDVEPFTPPALEHLHQFQENSRLVYLTGALDLTHLSMDAASQASMRRWCVFDVATEVIPNVGHGVAAAGPFATGLRMLLAHEGPDAHKLALCRTALEQRVAAQLEVVATQIAAGHTAQARQLLWETDRRYGGAAAPRSLELQATLGWELPATP